MYKRFGILATEFPKRLIVLWTIFAVVFSNTELKYITDLDHFKVGIVKIHAVIM